MIAWSPSYADVDITGVWATKAVLTVDVGAHGPWCLYEHEAGLSQATDNNNSHNDSDVFAVSMPVIRRTMLATKATIYAPVSVNRIVIGSAFYSNCHYPPDTGIA